MTVRAYRIAYDGRNYHGFQRQPDVLTVEDALLDALAALGICGSTTPPGYAAAGRTDAGVSALAQTVGFEAPDWLSPAAINGDLPPEVRAWASADAPPDFHATHDAAAREYTYHLHAPPERVDDGRARQTLSALAGEQDFHNLTPDDEGTVRDLEAALRREGEFLVLRFRAGGFARQLVRRLVTVVAESARSGLDDGRLDRLFGPDPVDGPAGVAPAPADGLVLTGVDYPGLAFEPDPDALASAREWFAGERAAAKRRARVVGSVTDALDRDTPG